MSTPTGPTPPPGGFAIDAVSMDMVTATVMTPVGPIGAVTWSLGPIHVQLQLNREGLGQVIERLKALYGELTTPGGIFLPPGTVLNNNASHVSPEDPTL
jgi:hypothetical protein